MKKQILLSAFLLSFLIVGFSNTLLCVNDGEQVNTNTLEQTYKYNPNTVNIKLNSNMDAGSFFYMAAAMLACNAYEYWGEDNRPAVEGIPGRLAVIRLNAYKIKSRVKSVVSGMGAILAFYVGSKFFINY